MKLPISSVLLAATMLLTGCVTHITTTVTTNPPPAEKFSAFSQFELKPVRLAPGYAGQEANERALVKIQENVSLKMDAALARWTARPKDVATARTLLIEPTVTEIKFINGSARFWAGAMAGSSAVILQASIVDKETGKVIASPMFYARAAAMGGAYTFGATDNLMLARIADRLTDFLIANYDEAVGGPTGAQPHGQ